MDMNKEKSQIPISNSKNLGVWDLGLGIWDLGFMSPAIALFILRLLLVLLLYGFLAALFWMLWQDVRAAAKVAVLGSTVAQELALLYPAKVRTAQLHGTWGRSDEWFVRMIETLEEPVKHGDMRAFIRYALMWITSPTFLAESKDAVRGMEEAFLGAPPDPKGVLGHIHADKTHDALDRLGKIRCPVLVTAGEMDVQVPPRYGKAVAERIPGARFHLFKGAHASHLACVEMADEFNRLTLDWLLKSGGPGGREGPPGPPGSTSRRRSPRDRGGSASTPARRRSRRSGRAPRGRGGRG